MGHRPALAAVRGVVFDMDGTLTAPFLIDFTAMRARTGILEGDLLAEIEKMETRADRERMTAIVEEEEEKVSQYTGLEYNRNTATPLWQNI
mmetsp:Transcript_13161/g.34438  ORF Transcript_13161/g.34438 Transcript_13161/m.34438 type:complete len:91 (-) Transcript_13161:1639-1911(-)